MERKQKRVFVIIARDGGEGMSGSRFCRRLKFDLNIIIISIFVKDEACVCVSNLHPSLWHPTRF